MDLMEFFPNLSHAKHLNESAKNRVIGLTIETRPDVCTKVHINEMLEYGATRVELGVQFPNDLIYKKIQMNEKNFLMLIKILGI